MSENIQTPPDSDALKAKYAEIAALKKSLDEKRAKQGIYSPYPMPNNGYRGRGRGGGAIRTGYNSRGYGGYGNFRGQNRSYRGRGSYHAPVMHRNVSAVFTQPPIDQSMTYDESQTVEGSLSDISTPEANGDSAQESTSRITGYVTTSSRGGMSLVSTDIYERDQQRYAAIQKQRQEIQERLERQRRLATWRARVSKFKTKTDGADRIKIGEETFAVTKQGTKLVPLTVPQEHSTNLYSWNNVTYKRQPNGTLQSIGIRKGKIPIEQCRYYSRTGKCTNFNLNRDIITNHGNFLSNLSIILIGQCKKGSKCKYIHERSKIRVCQANLQNKCSNQNCLYSHECSEFNTPICRYFLADKCTNQKCKYMHFKPDHYGEQDYEIGTCRPFSIGGWCFRGRRCPFLHLFTCPDFEEEGECPRGKSCYLQHNVNLRTQKLIQTPGLKYERIDDGVVVEDEDDKKYEEDIKDKKIVNSFTVDPQLLFVSRSAVGKYDIYIDKKGEEEAQVKKEPVDLAYTIVFSDSEEDETEDELQEEEAKTEPYVKIEEQDYIGLR
ncbi:uncharacterized protein RJT20DRAFT_45760 [Scheffersomyces xylosifermentans]|uniref:uncharacterized protein n=1 Tax=Scheffersomyces xylosifermentans TaxID=1304137 RepID=UPI00315D82D4